MRRDAENNIVVEAGEPITGLVAQAFEEKVRLIVLNAAGEVAMVTGSFPPSAEEIRDELKDAIVEAAKRYDAADTALYNESCAEDWWTQKLGALHGEMDSARQELMNAVGALNEHDRSERDEVEKHWRDHAFEPGDGTCFSMGSGPEECDRCGKSEAEHGKGGNDE